MKLLWMYWNERKPKLVQQIEEHTRKNLPSWKIIYLDDKTIHEYIPSFPPKYKTLIPTHQSDWIRLYLIMTYGGVWADASIIINSEKAMDKLWEKTKTHDFVGFYNGGKQNGIYEIVESWCFASKKNGILVTLWFHEFNQAIQEGYKPYRDRIMKNTNLSFYVKHKLLTDYFTVFYCLQNILQHQSTPSMYLLNAKDSMFKLHDECNWNPKCIINKLKTKKVKLPYIKLTRYERKTRINIDSYFKD